MNAIERQKYHQDKSIIGDELDSSKNVTGVAQPVKSKKIEKITVGVLAAAIGVATTAYGWQGATSQRLGRMDTKDPVVAQYRPELGSAVIEVRSKNFGKEVLESKEPVVIDVYADRCASCNAYASAFFHAAKRYSGTLKFARINKSTSAPIMIRYGIRELPTTLIIQDGKLKATFSGFMTEDELKARIDEVLRRQP